MQALTRSNGPVHEFCQLLRVDQEQVGAVTFRATAVLLIDQTRVVAFPHPWRLGALAWSLRRRWSWLGALAWSLRRSPRYDTFAIHANSLKAAGRQGKRHGLSA
ncbi:MAG TPA: hypothetical protein VGC06_14595 [Actinomycetes bacterium]